MRAALPGKPQAKLQAVCTGHWDDKRIIAYITGNAFVILNGSETILQTIYDDESSHLGAIAFDEATGKIATCCGSEIRIYKPYGQGEGALKWSLQDSLSLANTNDRVSTLCWGMGEELLVGSRFLSLYQTSETPRRIWQKELANPVKFAQFSYDSAFIATAGQYDRLVKVWRRLSFGSDDVRFDISYLPHPGTVTNIHWRRPYHIEQTIENVLYTVCSDNVLRIWAATDPHGLQILQQWGTIDLQQSIQPRANPTHSSAIRHVFLIDSRDFTMATEGAISSSNVPKGAEDHALEHLVEVANRSPEICVVVDDEGHMSAWGLENVGGKVRLPTNIFNIAHVEDFKLMGSDASSDDGDYVQFYNFCDKSSGKLTLLLHHFDGRIGVYESNVAELFDPVKRSDRITQKAIWTGHSDAIKKIVRNVSGKAVVSRTDGNECIVWKHRDTRQGGKLTRQSIISKNEHIHRICVLREGNFVAFLHHKKLTLWDCRSSRGVQVATCNYTVLGKPLCIIVLPEVHRNGSVAHIATITSQMKGIVWELELPNDVATIAGHNDTNGYSSASIKEFCSFDLGDYDELSYVLPVDPAGSAPVISGFLDTFARDVAISYTKTGLLRSWTVKVDSEAKKVDWLQTCSVETGIIEPSLASGSSIRKAALVNSNRSDLTIWDVRGGQLEYSQQFESQDTIQDLDWTSTPDDQSILAVGFRFRVQLLAQMRYDYLDKGPAWASIREINIRDLTPHPIGDSTWLGNGNLVIGSGNQLFVCDKTIDDPTIVSSRLRSSHGKDHHWDLFEVVTRLNGPLPVFHPQFLGQCILSGKTTLVHRILITLNTILKFRGEDEPIDNLLGMDLDDFYESDEAPSHTKSNGGTKSSFADLSGPSDDDDEEAVTEAFATSLNERLTTTTIPQLSSQEQMHLVDMIECVALVEKQRRSMDDNAARFVLFFRQHVLRRHRAKDLNLSWREINWAYHSNSQDILLDIVSKQFHGRMLWEHARESGIFMWMGDAAAVKQQFEAIARNEYTKSDMKNPIDCTLYYVALRKKTVLQGLWRMAGWNREQAATQRLLANNFQEPKWKTAALKNAYALLGKRRYEYAAAFFLLADQLKDAVNVCLNQLKDIQLAIAISRVYEGDDSPVLRDIIEDKILPFAAAEGNRWLASWAFWMLHRRDMAVRALISPVYTLLESPQSPDLHSKSFLTDDPALVVLYAQLRRKTLQTLQGASKVTPKVEWEFVLHSAQLYDRMGCDLLALDLVRNWEFLLLPPNKQVLSLDSPPDPRQMLRRRSSLVVADLPPPVHSEPSFKGKKPPAAVFEEPEANSLLDSFGF